MVLSFEMSLETDNTSNKTINELNNVLRSRVFTIHDIQKFPADTAVAVGV